VSYMLGGSSLDSKTDLDQYELFETRVFTGGTSGGNGFKS
jgi:hypothetical protein